MPVRLHLVAPFRVEEKTLITSTALKAPVAGTSVWPFEGKFHGRLIPFVLVRVFSTSAAPSMSPPVPERRSPAATGRLPCGRPSTPDGTHLQHDVATTRTGGGPVASIPPRSAGDRTRLSRAYEPYRKTHIRRLFARGAFSPPIRNAAEYSCPFSVRGERISPATNTAR
jgi:hypothetical protein